MVRDCLALLVMAEAPQLLPKWRCLIDVYFGRFDGRFALDWMCLSEYSSDFCEN